MSIEVKSLSFSYGTRSVLTDVSFTARQGKLLSVLGPNGVGKSTLFRCILGLLKGYSGQILVDGSDSKALTAREMARRVAYIPQSSYPAFSYSVHDMVLMGTQSRSGPFTAPGREAENLAAQALERLGIEDLAQRSYTKLSGGERQLVLIARALAQQSPILLMDEPTANLDYGNQLRVLSKVRALAEEGYSILQSTHNPEQAYLFSHEILAMKGGGVLALGAPEEVLTAGLVRELYGVEVEVESLRNDKMRVCIPKEELK
ncbi:ABC transporter, ATP-binding protein [uncultured Eubacteriales bacterium]|uniref:ABC transporter, ATP-binding protein n=1 Tax=uncultured Eubacteriales bacterium TaxID=172733 RepID=A0A212KFA0_9FIRM|nr:ABC transporter, ATP-binding protein [uncultured Eubacteriales bacterium]